MIVYPDEHNLGSGPKVEIDDSLAGTQFLYDERPT
jgi:hypothetical protein